MRAGLEQQYLQSSVGGSIDSACQQTREVGCQAENLQEGNKKDRKRVLEEETDGR